MADQSFPAPCAGNLEIESGHEDYFVVRGGCEAEGAVPQVAASLSISTQAVSIAGLLRVRYHCDRAHV
jgi:hypothetical protein